MQPKTTNGCELECDLQRIIFFPNSKSLIWKELPSGEYRFIKSRNWLLPLESINGHNNHKRLSWFQYNIEFVHKLEVKANDYWERNSDLFWIVNPWLWVERQCKKGGFHDFKQ